MIQKPRGTMDILPKDVKNWQYTEKIIRSICEIYGFKEMRLPTFEATELFVRGMGDTTDVVQKEMYTFTDRENRSFTLRPEGTANIMRSVIENSLYGDALPLKLYYIMNCFRYEKPQTGRSREYSTFGIEVIGSASAAIDGEVISLADTLFKKLGISDENYSLNINSIGCPECRPNYHKILIEYLKDNYDSLCDTCKTRFEKNPLRILDCKSDICKKVAEDAPKSKDYLCDDCESHFNKLMDYLKAMGIDFVVNPFIVRGLDYYTKTVFEFISDKIGAQSTICGGGRYDGLSEQIGGSANLCGIGFGIGMERLIMAAQADGAYFPEAVVPDIYIAPITDSTDSLKIKETAAGIVKALRDNGIIAETDVMDRSLKSQMKYADKIGARYTYVIGEREIAERKAVLKNMREKEQTECAFEDLSVFLGKNKNKQKNEEWR